MELNFFERQEDSLNIANLPSQSRKSLARSIKLDKHALDVLNEFDLNKLQAKSEDEISEKVAQYRKKMLSSVTYKNSIFENNPIKKLVSKKKIRFEFEGFDLDLTYITDSIIAMGYPADNIEKIYRNPVDEVKRFLKQRHNNRYKVFNLCEERAYPLDTFQAQAHYPFEDHEAPNIDLILPFCENVHEWLSAHPENVIAVHCKAGKGRTGVMICCYLIYCNFLSSADEALKYYGLMRTSNGKGVTIQSQIRYVEFFEQILKQKIPYPLSAPKLQLKKIMFNTVPNFNLLSSGCTPFFEIKNNYFFYSYKEHVENLHDFSVENKIEFSLENVFLKGDFRVIFYSERLIGSLKMFKFWFNTYFVPSDGVVVIKKKHLDLKQKHKKSVRFSEDFRVEVLFDMKNSLNYNNENGKDSKNEIFDFIDDVEVNGDSRENCG